MKPIVIGNWKMNNTLAESRELIRQLNTSIPLYERVEVVVCPPFPLLQTVRDTSGESIVLGAQNVYPAPKGAFTGEVSPDMLKELGCQYVLVGHSERRQIMREDDDFIARKVASCLQVGLTPVLCVGETLAERQQGLGLQVVSHQVRQGLKDAKPYAPSQMLVAYEPVWAIGTGHAASPEQAVEIIAEVRRTSHELLPQETSVRVLYGGSVNPANVALFTSHPQIDGALVGGASLVADHFAQIVRMTGESKR
jgi:triosephosphate isomerase